MSQEDSPATVTPAAAPPIEQTSLRDHPLGFWFFFWGEFAERCCFYGMRAILLLYMIQVLGFEDGEANRVQAYFMAACYLLPLAGGFVADRFLGKYRTIVYFSIPYILGQAALGVAALHQERFLYLSLGLLAMGTGVIKPNISTLMGLTYDQRRPGRTKLRSDAFAMFYGAINIGAAISSFGVPWIRNYYGGDSHAYAIAFLFPAALMVMAFIVFAAGKPFYAVETMKRVPPTPEERRERWVVLSRLFGLFLVVTVFWALYDQSVMTWVLFARDYLHLRLFGLPLSPDQIQAINPVLIVLLLPPITMLWHWLARVGFDLKPTSKMLIGFVLTTITMGIVTWAAFRGAAVATAGGPGALAAAEKAAAAATQAVTDSKANAAADALVAAFAAKRAAGAAEENGEAATTAAAESLEAARQLALEAEPVATVTAAASRAASEACRAAAAACAVAACAVAAPAEDAAPAAVGEALAAAKRVQAASDATTQAVKLARKTAREDGRKDSRLDAVGAMCAAVANRAAAAANAATKAAEAVAKANDRDAARVHAAVASLAAADAALQAVQATSEASGASPEAIIVATQEAAAAGQISLFWQLIPYLIITVAEICISVVGLELAFAAAPGSMKGFVTACWLLTVFFGDILNAQITPFYNDTVCGVSIMPGPYFLASTLLLIPVTLAFMLMSRRFNRATAAAAPQT